MKTVLFAWELGDGLGHVSRLLPIAKALRAEGVRCVFAVRNLVNCHPLVAREGFPVFAAPIVAPYEAPDLHGKPIASMGDVLATVGYSEPAKLAALVAAWEAIIDSVAADLIVADYSPTAALAAFGRTPVVHIGDWFTLPPGIWSEFRPFKEHPNRVDPGVLARTVAEVQRQRGRPAPDHVPQLVQGIRNFVLTLPELDPYQDYRKDTETGPLEPLPSPADQMPSQDYFAYLSNSYPGTQKVLTALADAQWRGEIYLRDAAEAVRAAWREKGLTVHDRPCDMLEMTAKSRVVIHHGGLGTLEQVLARGRPQLVIARHFEQQKNGMFVGKLGAGAVIRSGNRFQEDHIRQAMALLLENPNFAGNARRLAAQIAARGPFNLLARIKHYVLSTLGETA